MVRYFIFFAIFFLVFSCAKRPGDTNAGSIFDRWLASHQEQDIVPDENETITEEEALDEESEATPDEGEIPEHGIVEEEPDLAEEKPDEDHETPNDSIDILPDEDNAVDCTVVCTTDTCEDPCSGIVWQREANYSGPQANAVSFCSGLGGFGGYAKWKVPSIAELKTLRRGCDFDGGCPDVGTCYWDHEILGPCNKEHWSSTGAGGGAYYALNFRTGDVKPLPGSADLLVRCMVDNR